MISKERVKVQARPRILPPKRIFNGDASLMNGSYPFWNDLAMNYQVYIWMDIDSDQINPS